MTPDQLDYVNRVLAKTNGANVHTVRGKLGTVVACEELMQKIREKDPAMAARTEDTLNRVVAEIKQMTGVSR